MFVPPPKWCNQRSRSNWSCRRRRGSRRRPPEQEEEEEEEEVQSWWPWPYIYIYINLACRNESLCEEKKGRRHKGERGPHGMLYREEVE